MQPMSHRSLNLIKLAVSLSLVALILFRMDIDETWRLIGRIDLRYLGAVLAINVFGIFISVWKWSLVAKTVGAAHPFYSLLRLFWIGAFFNNFLPGRTGGDLIRAYGIARDAQNRIGAALSVAIDRGLNLMALVIIALAALAVESGGGLPASVRLWLISWGLGLCAAGSLALLIGLKISRRLKREGRIHHLLTEISRTGRIFLHRPPQFLAAITLAGLYQTTMILGNYGVARGLGLDVAPGFFFYLIPITALVTLIPVSLNGLGLREGAYALAFVQVGISVEAAVAISVVSTLCMILISLVGGVLYATDSLQIEKRPNISVVACGQAPSFTGSACIHSIREVKQSGV